MDRAISPTDDGYFDRVLKCIPVEVTSVYVLLLSAADTAFAGTTLRWWTFLLFAFGLVAVPAYGRMVLGIRRGTHLGMMTLAFGVIVAVSGGWFATFSWWSGYYALLVTVVFGVSVALLQFGPPRPRPPRARVGTATPPASQAEPALAPAHEPGEPAAGTAPDDQDSALLRVWRGVDPPGSVRP